MLKQRLLRYARNDRGIGLTILVAIIAIAGIVMLSSGRVLQNMSRRTQLLVDQEKAHYLAQAGIMRAIYDWRISNATETLRRYTGLRPVAVTGSLFYQTKTNVAADQGTAANYAYFNFNSGPAVWGVTAGRKRLQSWSLMNIRVNDGASTNDNIIVTQAKVSWTPNAAGNQATLRTISLNGTVFVAAGAFANGATITGTALVAARTLAPAAAFAGATTYLEWNTTTDAGAPQDPIDPLIVTVQWTFSDDSATRDSKTHEVVYWGLATNGIISTVLQAGAAPARRTFCITSTGLVNQSVDNYFPVLKTVRATVSGTPANPEIIDWDELDKNIP